MSHCVLLQSSADEIEVGSSESLQMRLDSYYENSKNDRVTETLQARTIASENWMIDSQGVRYSVVDFVPAGYAIYAITGSGRVLIEGSDAVNSPYFGTEYAEIYYGGIGEYYALDYNGWKNLLTNRNVESEPEMSLTYNFNSKVMSENSLGENAPKLSSSSNGRKSIANASYFSSLSSFPDHVMPGTCGVVAVCMLLGYYDEYINSNVIKNSSYKNGNGTNNVFANYLFDNWIWDGKSILAEGTILGAYDANPNSDNAGFPMAAVENRQLIKKYFDSINLNGATHTASSWFPKPNVEKKIDNNIPVIGTTTSYKMSGDSEKSKSFHNVIIYGYSGDTYRCHMGWRPGSTYYADIYLSELALHSYYALDL